MSYIKRISISESEHTNNAGRLIQKLCCCSLIDTLSIARFGDNVNNKKFKTLTNRERFKMFVKDYTSYNHWDKISIPQIFYNRELIDNAKFKKLRFYAESILAHKDQYSGYSIQEDPLYAELIKDFPELKEDIESRSYLTLFYKYRCKLVHEMREPGYGFEEPQDDTLFYLSVTGLDTNRLTFQLVYPVGFFFKTCDECIHNLECYFQEVNKSPYDAFESKFGDVW